MKFVPLYGRVLVKRKEREDRSASGLLVIPEAAKERPSEGTVVAVGDAWCNQRGVWEKPTVELGNTVLFGRNSGALVKIENEEYLIIREDELLGYFRGP